MNYVTGGRPNLWFMNIGKAALYSALDNAHLPIRARSLYSCVHKHELFIIGMVKTSNTALHHTNHSHHKSEFKHF